MPNIFLFFFNTKLVGCLHWPSWDSGLFLKLIVAKSLQHTCWIELRKRWTHPPSLDECESDYCICLNQPLIGHSLNLFLLNKLWTSPVRGFREEEAWEPWGLVLTVALCPSHPTPVSFMTHTTCTPACHLLPDSGYSWQCFPLRPPWSCQHSCFPVKIISNQESNVYGTWCVDREVP